MRKLAYLLVVLTAAAGGLLALRRSADGEAPETPRYKTAIAAVAPIRVTVAAQGVVEPSFKVEVKSKASGEVVSFPLEPGDRVEAGAPLVELNPADEARNVRLRESDVVSTRASQAAAEADLGLAEARLIRADDLAKRSMMSPEELESARFGRARALAAVDLARAAVLRSEIAIEEARQRLKDTKIDAPIAGVILTKAVDKGHIIASGITSVSGGTTLATIADMSRVYVLAKVNEADVGKVKIGAAVRITADAYRDVKLDGRVVRVLPLGVEQQNVMIFQVKIEVTSPEKSQLLPNMTADAQIHVAEKEEAIVVPSVALRQRDGKSGVEVLAAGATTAEFRPVERGLTDGNVTEVTGVKPGEVVVTGEEKPEEKGGFRLFGGPPKKTTTGTSSTSTSAKK